MLELHVHPAARPWVPDEAYLTPIRKFFRTGAVYLWPRSAVDQVIGRVTRPYEFRAVTRGEISHVFVDETETPQSIAWLMSHELCHQVVNGSPTMTAAFDDSKPLDMNPASDEYHQVDAEERFCDGVATRLLGYRQDRAWWRERVTALLSRDQ